MDRRTVIQNLPKPIRNCVIDSFAFVHQQRQGTERDRPPLAYWRRPPGEGHGNSPEAYAETTTNWDAEWMLRTVARQFPHTGSVLEFGCNAGRVLRYFARAGYVVTGLEINPSAIALARKTFPELRGATLLAGNGEETLRTLPTASVDASYSSHALRHVGPSIIESVARELTRVTKDLLIVSEDEGTRSSLSYPRNYRKLFEPMGWKQVDKRYAIDLGDPGYLSLASLVRVFRHG